MTNLSQFKLNGTTPFWSAADSADQCLNEAHALLTLLAGAHDVCEEITTEQGDAFDNLRHGIKSQALDGIAKLIAIAQYQSEVAHDERAARNSAPKWIALRDAYLTAKADTAAHCATKCAPHDTPECEAYEAETERLANAEGAAFEALMLFPAPDAKALAFKTEVFTAMTRGEEWHNGHDLLSQLTTDAKRLAA